MKLFRLVTAMSILAASATAVAAHGVWVAERWGDLGVIYGHGAEDSPYDPSKVTSAKAIDESGAPIELEAKADGDRVWLMGTTEPAVILIDFDNGFWSKASDGNWVNEPKSKVPGATEAGHYVKHNISLIHLHGDIPPLPAQTLQIVPLANPSEMKAGDTLRVRVMFEGKPLAGAKLMADYINDSETASAESDAEGKAEIVIRNNGLNVIAISHELPLTGDPDADTIGYFATLRFLANAEHEG